MTLGLAIGLDQNSLNDATGPELHIKSILSEIDPLIGQQATKINQLKVIVSISSYTDLEKFYNQCTASISRILSKYSSSGLRRIVMILASDDTGGTAANAVAQEILHAILNDQTTTPAALLYITKEVYDTLDYKGRDNYHSAVDIVGIKAHRRFGEDCLNCFVVSPIGEPDSPIRVRADIVFEHFIKPACEATEYRPKRSDMRIDDRITNAMYNSLKVSPLVAVYLGSSPWNPNVMVELGYRLSTNKPVIILKDASADAKDLPFDIKDYNYIDIPHNVDTLSPEDHFSIVRRIRDFISAGPGRAWQYNYPAAVYDVSQGKVKIVEVYGGIEELFGIHNLIERDVREILDIVYAKMPEKQAAKIKSEQAQLIGLIVLGATEGVYATIPFLFDKHPKYNGRAFLPVIDSFATPEDGVLRLRVTYFEVTGAVRKHAEGYYYCDLTTLPIPADAPGAVVVPLNTAASH